MRHARSRERAGYTSGSPVFPSACLLLTSDRSAFGSNQGDQHGLEQDVPIDAARQARIMARLGEELPPGLVAHIAIERDDDYASYLAGREPG